MRVTVLGASGGIGAAITHELAARGHAVVAASRTPDPATLPAAARVLPTDLRDPGQADAACRGAEVVVMAALVPYPQWHDELAPLFDAALGAAERAGARLVVVDNLYAYGSPGVPIHERTPEAARSVKGRLRRDLGRRLLAAHHEGRVPVSLGRFSDYYGPGGTNSLVYELLVRPAISGRTVRTYIDADQPHTFHYLPDAARGFATLVEHDAADGEPWILPAAPAPTQRELADLLEGVVGRRLRRGHVSRPMLRLAGVFDRRLREALELTDQWDRPYRVDASRFEATFGAIEVTPHADALEATVRAFTDTATAGPAARQVSGR